MTSIALARKWRPRTFAELMGQDHVSRALMHSLTNQRLHHAYLFTGTRGVGKTSIARLLAKALNCEQQTNSEPCLHCDTCLAIEQGCYVDLIEIDAASKTRVEDTRELLDNVAYAPTLGRFKIYLIDEVHMLSQHSFNALLKTLEEPPEHVKFLLATTDPQKLPLTVLSRCLQFHLKPLAPNIIEQQLRMILEKEHISYESEALLLLAKAAQGSMRDALSLLDQSIASGHGRLCVSEVKQHLGLTHAEHAQQLLQALASNDVETLLALSQQIECEGGSYQHVLQDMLSHLHQMSIKQAIKQSTTFTACSPEITVLSQVFSPEETQLLYQIALKGSQDLSLAPTLMIGFEMTLLRMHTFAPVKEQHAPPKLHEHPFRLVEPVAPIITKSSHEQSHVTVHVDTTDHDITHEPDTMIEIPSTQDIEPVAVNPVIEETMVIDNDTVHAELSTHEHDTTHAPLAFIFDDESNHHTMIDAPLEPTSLETKQSQESTQPIVWDDVIKQLQLSGLAHAALENTEFVSYEHDCITLRIATSHRSLLTPATLQKVEQALKKHFGESTILALQHDDATQASPAQNKRRTTQLKQQQAEEALQADPFFQTLQQSFSGELVKDSIELSKDSI